LHPKLLIRDSDPRKFTYNIFQRAHLLFILVMNYIVNFLMYSSANSCYRITACVETLMDAQTHSSRKRWTQIFTNCF